MMQACSVKSLTRRTVSEITEVRGHLKSVFIFFERKCLLIIYAPPPPSRLYRQQIDFLEEKRKLKGVEVALYF